MVDSRKVHMYAILALNLNPCQTMNQYNSSLFKNHTNRQINKKIQPLYYTYGINIAHSSAPEHLSDLVTENWALSYSFHAHLSHNAAKKSCIQLLNYRKLWALACTAVMGHLVDLSML